MVSVAYKPMQKPVGGQEQEPQQPMAVDEHDNVTPVIVKVCSPV